MSNRTLKRSSMALPAPLLEWLDDEAKSFGMTRNSFLTMKLMMCKETQHGERLRRLETRVAQLEHKVNSGL
jgi:hypothetical protein